MIRLAPRLASCSVEIGQGLRLDLDAVSPAAWRACVRWASLRLLGRDDDIATRVSVMFDAAWVHFVVGWSAVDDADGAPLPPSLAMRDALIAQAPHLDAPMRAALDEHLAAAVLAEQEGNVSPPSPSGAPGAAANSAPTALMSPGAAAPAAPAGAGPNPAPKTLTQ